VVHKASALCSATEGIGDHRPGLDLDLVYVAPPVLAALNPELDDGMTGLVKVPGCVFPRRRITAANVAADKAQAQVHPPTTGLQTDLASLGVGSRNPNLINVLAFRHLVISSCEFFPYSRLYLYHILIFTICQIKIKLRKYGRARIPFKLMDVTQAAHIILKGVVRNRPFIVFPFYARLLWWLYRIHPALLHPLSRKTVEDFRAVRTEA
jgi:hypothetical protein